MNIIKPILPEKPSQRLQWGEIFGSSLGLIIANTAIQYNGFVVVITPNTAIANSLQHELQFFNTNSDLPILYFPDWETLPYDRFSPHADIISERLLVLNRLVNTRQGILVISINTLLQRLPPSTYLLNNVFFISKGDKLNLDLLRKRFSEAGYRCVSQVLEHGEYAVRGSIFDIFPMGSELPYRIDLFADEVDSIRLFDPVAQRSLKEVNEIKLLPAHEFPFQEQSIAEFRRQWRNRFSGDPTQCPLYQAVSQGVCAAGIEYYLPLFFENLSPLFSYLREDALLLKLNDLNKSVELYAQEIKERYEQLRYDVTRPILSPNELFLPIDELFANINQFKTIQIQTDASFKQDKKYHISFATQSPPDLLIDSKSPNPLNALQNFLDSHSHRVLFTVESTGRREIILDLLRDIGIHPKNYDSWANFLNDDVRLGITIASLENGVFLREPPLIVIAESQLVGHAVVKYRGRKSKAQDNEAIIKNLTELNIGSPVVHIDHGVGRYRGLKTLTVDSREAEFLHLEYEGGDSLYVPVSSLNLISRYSGTDLEHAPLHRLGTDQWSRAKRKAAEQLRDVAAELLDVYAQRAARNGFAFVAPDKHYHRFAASFPFEETDDQKQAINDVINDMVSGKPMDRLICGDVGFGKTEVAIRAAFLSVQSSKQVALLVPTTLLAQQHFATFRDRFAGWPINIDMVSRFRSKKEQDFIFERLKQGKIDILIGTHVLLQSKVEFKSLGLLIIDEEHRFGVRQKERLKKLRSEVDILTLTATPIPRTLNMAISGLRELSLITTPPARRLSIKTFLHEYDDNLIREAILREILRGGQVYFVHNKVETIERTLTRLSQLVPEARIGMAHGQMPERELEKIMSDFYHQRFNILICTTIIETGIDIPSANTIIIDRADHFGLAQLHQLRGRVGRSHHQAYAYLLIPNQKLITTDAQKRLDAITALEELGIGFTLATHDLEIRGAGELLGEGQSGNINTIGFSLYMELLEQTVEALRAGKEPLLDRPLIQTTEIDLQIPALIPEVYLSDVQLRLMFYKRIAHAKNLAELEELQVEMIDRFGLFPESVKNLFRLAQLRLKAQVLGIRKIEAGAQSGRLEFYPDTTVDLCQLIKLIQESPDHYQFNGQERLKFILPMNSTEERLATVDSLLARLNNH